MSSSAEESVQHSQEISWQSRQKTSGLVRVGILFYRGISILSIVGNIFAMILLNIVSTHIISQVIPETQCGFRVNWSTVYMIFCLRQLQEKCTEQDRPLYTIFVDFSKAFDTVGRTGLWQLLRKNGCPGKFTTKIEALQPEWLRMLVLEGRSRSMSRMVSIKVVYWPPRSSPSSYQQCSTRHYET